MTTPKRGAGRMSEQRRHRIRLEISREAARLFWEQGVEGTSGDQIAAAVGLSTRTIWRHFRSKESCAEPIVRQGVERAMSSLRRWPRHLSLEEHFRTENERYGRERDAVEPSDNQLAMRMIHLADREPAIRTAWLMACDQVEREMATIIAERLELPPDDLQVRLHAAAASAALRVINEQIGTELFRGVDDLGADAVSQRVADAVRKATGGDVGDAVAS